MEGDNGGDKAASALLQSGAESLVTGTASAAQEVTPCCSHRVTHVAPRLAELCSPWWIWPGPKEGADSAALLGAGFPGSQVQWAGLTCESRGY